jgi:hypothetical protein
MKNFELRQMQLRKTTSKRLREWRLLPSCGATSGFASGKKVFFLPLDGDRQVFDRSYHM